MGICDKEMCSIPCCPEVMESLCGKFEESKATTRQEELVDFFDPTTGQKVQVTPQEKTRRLQECLGTPATEGMGVRGPDQPFGDVPPIPPTGFPPPVPTGFPPAPSPYGSPNYVAFVNDYNRRHAEALGFSGWNDVNGPFWVHGSIDRTRDARQDYRSFHGRKCAFIFCCPRTRLVGCSRF